MKKNIISFLFLLVLSLAPWACKPFPILPIPPGFPPTPTPIALFTSTPTPNLTPVCGYSVIPLGLISAKANPLVIRNLADWQAYNSNGTGLIYPPSTPTPVTPAPPVDFTKQMLIVTLQPICPAYDQVITNICEGPNQITVSANQTQKCAVCYAISSSESATGYVIPQSSLPVTWAITNYPCVYLPYLTPTPTATP